MDKEPAFGFEHLVTFAVTEMATAVSVRNGETAAQQFARCQAAAHMIMGFQPRDAIEVMLAGHCVMLHEVMTADIRDGLGSEAAANRRTLIALNKAFNDDLGRLELYRQRPAEGKRDAPEVPPVTAAAAVPAGKPELPSANDVQAMPVEPAGSPVPAKLNRAARRQAARAELRAVATASRAASRQTGPLPAAVSPNVAGQTADRPEGTIFDQPAREAVTKCHGNRFASLQRSPLIKLRTSS